MLVLERVRVHWGEWEREPVSYSFHCSAAGSVAELQGIRASWKPVSNRISHYWHQIPVNMNAISRCSVENEADVGQLAFN